MVKKPAVLDRHDRALQVRRNLAERDVVPLLVQVKPWLPVRAVEHRVADTAREAMDDHRVSRQPDRGDASADEQRDEQRKRDPVDQPARTKDVQRSSPLRVVNAYTSAAAKIATIKPSANHSGIRNAM